MLLGNSMAVIWVPRVNQCAETTNTAFGVGISFAIIVHVWLNPVSSIPFIGEPWPMKRTGITCSLDGNSLVKCLNADKVVMPVAPVTIVFINCFLFMQKLY